MVDKYLPIGLTFFGRTKIDLKLGLILRRWARIALLLLLRLILLFLLVLVVGGAIVGVCGSFGSSDSIAITESDFLSNRLDESLVEIVGVLAGLVIACSGSSLLLLLALIKLTVSVVIGRVLELLYGWLRSELMTWTLLTCYKLNENDRYRVKIFILSKNLGNQVRWNFNST